MVLIKSEVWLSFSHIPIPGCSLMTWYLGIEDMGHAGVFYVR